MSPFAQLAFFALCPCEAPFTTTFSHFHLYRDILRKSSVGQNTTDDLACIKYKVDAFGCQLSKCWPLPKMDEKSGATQSRVAPVSFCRVFGVGQLSDALFFCYRRQDFLRAWYRACVGSTEHPFCRPFTSFRASPERSEGSQARVNEILRALPVSAAARRRAARRRALNDTVQGSTSRQMDALCPSGATRVACRGPGTKSRLGQ